MDNLTHINQEGKINMVDVSDKHIQNRIARAEGFIKLKPSALEAVREQNLKKGDVFSAAKIAGIMAAKKTWDLIPLCHNIQLNKVEIELDFEESGIKATSIVKSSGKTGVEMEALTAVSLSLLTIYDMCKSIDKEMVILNIRLIDKFKEDL